MRINNAGDLRYCRWSTEFQPSNVGNIKTQYPLKYFRLDMMEVRRDLLDGDRPDACVECHNMEAHGKISGRERQLLKTGIRLAEFEKTVQSSPYYNNFVHSQMSEGYSVTGVRDWHIDLGNFCNSGCVFCIPESSSRIASEFFKLKLIDKLPPRNWCDDPELVERFLEDSLSQQGFQFLHFIGGETVITPAFETILQRIVDANRQHDYAIGFTTNLTVWPQKIINLIEQFDEVHLGMSIECTNRVNDYARWPSQIDSVLDILNSWRELGVNKNWIMTLRITPTPITVAHFHTVYEYALEHNLNVESCNFLHNPRFMRVTVLPVDLRENLAKNLEAWIKKQNIEQGSQVLNIRNPNFRRRAVIQDAQSYIHYLRHGPDETQRLGELVTYLRQIDNNRGISVLDYCPEYEELFRAAGY